MRNAEQLRTVKLPVRFSGLEAYADRWANSDSNQLHHFRQTSPYEETFAFYHAIQPRITEIFDYLDGFDLDDLPPDAERLLYLTFGFVEASLAVDLFHSPGIAGAPYPHGFRLARELPRPWLTASGSRKRAK